MEKGMNNPNICAPILIISNCGMILRNFAYLVELVDTLDLKSDFSKKSIGSSPVISKKFLIV